MYFLLFGWNHWLDGHEYEQILGVGDGQGSLACCSWGHKESDMTEWLTLSLWVVLLCVSALKWTAANQASRSFTISQTLLKFMSIESVTPSNHLILCHPFLLPSIFSSIRVFSSESLLCIRWPEYWSFSFSISPSNEYSGLISFRMDRLDLLEVQGTLKSLLQHRSSKASVL